MAGVAGDIAAHILDFAVPSELERLRAEVDDLRFRLEHTHENLERYQCALAMLLVASGRTTLTTLQEVAGMDTIRQFTYTHMLDDLVCILRELRHDIRTGILDQMFRCNLRGQYYHELLNLYSLVADAEMDSDTDMPAEDDDAMAADDQ